jgi:hypothetical protein
VLIDPEVQQDALHQGRVEAVKEMRDVQEDNHANLASTDGGFCLILEHRHGVRCRVEVPRAKLGGRDQPVTVDVRTQSSCDYLLQNLPNAL